MDTYQKEKEIKEIVRSCREAIAIATDHWESRDRKVQVAAMLLMDEIGDLAALTALGGYTARGSMTDLLKRKVKEVKSVAGFISSTCGGKK